MPSFSARLPRRMSPNRWSAALARAGSPRYDLTVSNPTRCGLDYPSDLLEPLADVENLSYDPDSRGLESARRAVVTSCLDNDVATDPDRVVLTASTSEAYSLLFKLLCDPGDAVLTPRPSYPLFEHLARIDAVQTVPFQLSHDDGWRLAPGALDAAPATTRAVIVVHPNNPTGSYIHPDDRDLIVNRCRTSDWALIADEVFFDYRHASVPGSGTSFARPERCLTFTLGGLSKSIGMPQLKLSWMVVGGPEEIVAKSLERIDYLNDAYLSVATPVSRALPRLIERGQAVRRSLVARCRANLRILGQLGRQEPAVTVLPPAGGWSAVLRIPSVLDEESFILRLLERRGVAVHPGFFYDFPGDGFLVLSLLPPEEVMAEGLDRLLSELRRVLDEV